MAGKSKLILRVADAIARSCKARYEVWASGGARCLHGDPVSSQSMGQSCPAPTTAAGLGYLDTSHFLSWIGPSGCPVSMEIPCPVRTITHPSREWLRLHGTNQKFVTLQLQKKGSGRPACPSFTPCWLVTWANSQSPGTLVVIEKVFSL